MSYAPPSMRLRLNRRASAIPHSAFRIPHLKPGEFLKRFNLCHGCPWNLDWVCQHTGCKVCPGKQAKMGEEPLKHLLAEPFFKCPMNKF